MNESTAARPSRRNLIIGTGAALVAGAAIVVLFILPAETGIDPTGAGEATGLSKIANPDASLFLERGMKRKGVFTAGDIPLESAPGARDHWEFKLHPYESIELKYVIEKGKPIAFRWSASAPLKYDMHAHPFEGGEAQTESYSIAKADRLAGRYVAPFAGIHGWHWQNRGLETVQLKLDASGDMTGSLLIDGGGEHERKLSQPAR